MTIKDDPKIDKLKQAIAQLESQREILGDETVRESLKPLRKKLASLEGSILEFEQQRKLATILFTDVVGSTRLGQHLEPDEVLDLMDKSLKRLATAVQQHGGHVTRFQGDGFKAIFGAPVAHENDPEMAVRAGLGILEISQEIAREWEELHGIPNFQVRVGVNTGLIASGGETEAQDTIMGRAVNLAARLESAAPPGGLFISHHTYRHVRGVFEVEVMPPIQAKGFDEPVAVYQVKAARPRSFCVLSRGVEGIETRMVGRETELKLLQDALLTAMEEGEGQVVMVSGEAGVGKSRLIYEFQNWIELLPQEIWLFLGQSRQETQHLPYALLRDLFAFRFQIQDSDRAEMVRTKFEDGIAEAISASTHGLQWSWASKPGELFPSPPMIDDQQASIQSRTHLLGQLLGFDFRHSPHLKGFLQDPQALRNQGLLSLEAYFGALCKQAPVVVLLEDLHWADDSSLDAIRQLGKQTPHLPLLLVCLARQQLYDRRPFWGEGQENHLKLELRPLAKRESRQLVEEILQKVEKVPLALRELVVNGAEGNPFYTEEMIKMLLEQGVILIKEAGERWEVVVDRLAKVELPSTLAGVLQARLDSLPLGERVVLQQASVVGRTFWDRLVEHLSAHGDGKQDGKTLNDVLIALRAKEMVFRREDTSIAGAQEYTFKHDVLREVTYETVLVKVRRRYHSLVADWLIANCGKRLGEYYGLIAEHLEQAGSQQQAAETFLKAGDQSLDRYANPEAEGYYRRALTLGAADRLRAQLIAGLGRALGRQGFYEEALHCWKEGIEIYRLLGDREAIIDLYTLAIRGSLPLHPRQAMQLSQAGLEVSGELEEGLTLAHFLSQVGTAYFLNGFPELALRYSQHALELGERLGDAQVQAASLSIIGGLPYLTHEEQLKVLQRAVKLAEENHLLALLRLSANNLGVVYADILGNFREAMRYALRSAEAARLRGDHERELFALSNALCVAQQIGDLGMTKELLKQISARQEALPHMEEMRLITDAQRAVYLRQKGDWMLALETARQALQGLHSQGMLDPCFDCVTDALVPALLGIDRFLAKPDWSEAERAVNELLERTEQGDTSCGAGVRSVQYFLMSILYSRQGRLKPAARWMQQGRKLIRDTPTHRERWISSQAEVELAVAHKDWTQALENHAAYKDFVEQHGMRWEVARTYLDWGDTLMARCEPGDQERAQELYRQALDIFTDMEADGYVNVLKERIEGLVHDRNR